ncbi:MAG: reductive dehalogenase [Pseudomonadota bacterium]
MTLKNSLLEQVLEPFEKKPRAQERLRRRLGVREVERPTYERYITGPIERFHSQKNAFAAMKPDNPFGQEFREKYLNRTGLDQYFQPLPESDLEPQDRLGQALTKAAMRLCMEYHPQPLPLTPPEGRIEVEDKAHMSRLIKKVALWCGAEIVRITRIDPRWVYVDKEINHPYAIVVAVSHDREQLDTAPSFLSGCSTAQAYSRLKYITTQLTDFIRFLGYDAAYRETLGPDPDMLMVPLAIDAGIGEFSRNARCLSPEFGTNIRLKAVTTDLPLEVDRPISFGVHEFCLACENCAKYCPSNAVPFGEPTEAPDSMFNNPGFKKWYIRADRCLIFWAANPKKWITCGGRCIAVCPWNKPLNYFHNMVRWMAIRGPRSLIKGLVWSDRVFYQRRKKITK